MHLNNRGEVAGRYKIGTGCDAAFVSFVWSSGAFRYVSVPGAFNTSAESVNDLGFVTGGAYMEPFVRDPATGKCGYVPRQGFVMSPRGETQMPPWDAYHSVVNNIAPNGWMTGPTAPCDWRTGAEGCLFYGFLFNGREEPLVIQPPDCPWTDAVDVNSRGEVVGGCSADLGLRTEHGFRFRNGRYEIIDYPGAVDTYLTGTNLAGDIVGSASIAGQDKRVSFIFSRGRFARIELTGAEVVTATVWDVNELGTISGWFTDGNGRQRGFIARPMR